MKSIEREAVERYLRSNMPAYLELLEEWVSINSFTINKGGVNLLGDVTARAFADLGFTVERVPSENLNFGDHFVLNRTGTGSDTIGLVSHLDTVFPADEEQQNAFFWRLEGERIYGPGTVDIKGGTLMIFMLLQAMRAFDSALFDATSWCVLLDASEETMSEDFGALCRDRLSDALACLVFEGGFYEEDVFKLVQMRKGMAKFRVVVNGKAAHAGVAHPDGANAIVQISDTIREIASFTDYEKNITFNVGAVKGGTVPNRVPHYAEAIGEMRAFEKAVFDEGLTKLLALHGQQHVTSPTGALCHVIVDVFEISRPWSRNDATDQLLSVWQSTAEKMGFRVLPEARGGLSDGNHVWDLLPTIDGLGPGGGNAHCSVHEPQNGIEQEYLHLPSLLPKTVLNLFAIRAFLNGQDA